MAQCCCWCGITTTRQVWHGLEESIWAALAAGMLPALLFVGSCCGALAGRPALAELCSSRGDSGGPLLAAPLRVAIPAGLGATQRFARVGSVCSVTFVAFMVSVDIPMYLARWRADEERGHAYLSVWEGLVDSMRCDRISRDWAVWQEDVPWMSAYFTACVWASLWIAWAAPTLELPCGDDDDDEKEEEASSSSKEKRS